MIYLVTGKNRSGKDHFVVKQIEKIWRRTGVQIYTNQPLNLKRPLINFFRVKIFHEPKGFTELEEIFHVTNCIIYFTEGQELFDAQYWEQLPRRFKRKLNIHAHDRIDIWVTTPHARMIDITYRRLVHRWFHGHRVFQIGKYKSYFGLFIVREKDDDYFDISPDPNQVPEVPIPIFMLFKYVRIIWYFSRKRYNTEQSFAFKNYKVICLYDPQAKKKEYHIIPKQDKLRLEY